MRTVCSAKRIKSAFMFPELDGENGRIVEIRPRKARNYPNLGSDGWVSYDKVGILYSGKLGSRLDGFRMIRLAFYIRES